MSDNRTESAKQLDFILVSFCGLNPAYYNHEWHVFARSVLTELNALVLHPEQRAAIESAIEVHTTDNPRVDFETAAARLKAVPKQAPPLMHINRIPEFSLETVGDAACRAAAASCCDVYDNDYPQRVREFTAAVAEAHAYAAQATQCRDIMRGSEYPAQMHQRLDALRTATEEATYERLEKQLVNVLLDETFN